MKKQGVCDKCGLNTQVYSYTDFGYEKGVYKNLREYLSCEKCGIRICSSCGKRGMYLTLYGDPHDISKSYCHDCKDKEILFKYKK